MPDNPIKHSDIIQPGNPFDETIKGLEQLIKLLKKAAKDYLSFAEKQNVATKEGRRNIQNVAKATAQLTAKEKEALKIKQQLEQAQAKLKATNSKEYKELIRTREAVAAKNRELRNAAKAMRTGERTTNTWAKALGSFAFKFNSLGNIMAMVAQRITRTFTKAVKGAFETITTFEQTMADVRAVTNASNKDFKALSKSARDLGGATKFTAIEVAKLQKEYAKLGFSTEEILNTSKATLDLAAATNTELPRAAEVVGITLRQFGLDASEATRVTDVMAKSFTTSALDMEKFAESMKFVGPVAKNAGLTIEQTTARLAQMADAGISGSMGGTALRQIFLQLAKSGKGAAEGIAELSMQELGLAEASEAVKQRAATALLVLADGVDTVDDFTEALENSAGAAEDMANIQLDTLEGQITILKSAWDRYILSLATSEEQFILIKAVLEGTSSGLNEMSDSVEKNKEEASKFNKALNNIWSSAVRAIPIFGTFKMKTDEMKYSLVEAKKAAEGADEAIDNLNEPLEEEELKEDLKTIKKETLNTLNETLSNLKEKRGDASLFEIAAINREIAALEEKIKKYKEAGLAQPLPAVKDITLGEVEDGDLGFDVDKFGNIVLDWTRQTNKEKLREDKEYLTKRAQQQDAADAAEKEKLSQKEEKKRAIIDESFAYMSNSISTLGNLFESQKQKELSAVGDNAKKREAIEKKYARRQQIIAISQSIIDGAAAIMKTYRNMGGFPIALPFVIAQAAATAAQIGIIASQKFAEGGPVIGVSHDRGGVQIEAEGGEYIINKRSTARYNDLIHAINADDTAAIANAALQNEAFHDVWGRTKTRETIVKADDPWMRRLYELQAKTPVHIPQGKREEYYPATGKRRIING